jgi:hypothetical protein
MHIARHPFDKNKLEDYYAVELKSIENSLNIFNSGKYFVLRDMYNKTLAAACCSVILEKGKDEIHRQFYLFLDVAIGKFKMGTNVGNEISFSFLGKQYSYRPEEKNYTLTDQGWITAFLSALLFLDLGKISELNEIDLDKVQQVTNVKGAEYTILYAKFLQHVFKNDQNNFENLKTVSEAIKPDRVPPEIFRYANDIVGGQVDLFGAALLKETPYFNEVFLKAVQWHKDFYSSDTQNPEGLFSIPLTAISALAKYYKIEIQHSSDYTPSLFIDGF